MHVSKSKHTHKHTLTDACATSTVLHYLRIIMTEIESNPHDPALAAFLPTPHPFLLEWLHLWGGAGRRSPKGNLGWEGEWRRGAMLSHWAPVSADGSAWGMPLIRLEGVGGKSKYVWVRKHWAGMRCQRPLTIFSIILTHANMPYTCIHAYIDMLLKTGHANITTKTKKHHQSSIQPAGRL